MLEPATMFVTPALLRVTEPPSCAFPPPDNPVPAVTVIELLVNCALEIVPLKTLVGIVVDAVCAPVPLAYS